MTPKLTAYLRRIGYGGPLDPSLRTLRALHRAHLLAVPYENLDIQCGLPVGLDTDAIYEKIVGRRRGGWCYEMNGLFAWALRELGFSFSLLGGAANREERGADAELSHLAVLVHLDKTYLADVGFGNGFLVPIPLAEGAHSDGRFSFGLERLEDGWWRLRNRAESGDSFDFRETPYELPAFAEKSAFLQSAPGSYFVQNLVCHRFTEEGVVTLRGAVLTTVTPAEIREEIVQSRDALAQVLQTHFDLQPDGIDALWERVSARHEEWLSARLPGARLPIV